MDDGKYQDFNPPPIPKSKGTPAKKQWSRGTLRIISPQRMLDWVGRTFNQRFRMHVARQNPRDQVRWKLDWKVVDWIPRGWEQFGGNFSEAFEELRDRGYWKELHGILKAGPRRLNLPLGALNEDAKAPFVHRASGKDMKATADCVIMELVSDLERETLGRWIREIGQFVDIYWGETGTIKEATHELAVSRLTQTLADDGKSRRVAIFDELLAMCIKETERSDDDLIDDLGLHNETDDQKAQLVHEYRRGWIDRTEFVRDVLPDQKRFMDDRKAVSKLNDLMNNATTRVRVHRDFIGLNNLARAATGDEMDPTADPFGNLDHVRLDDLLTLTVAHMVKGRLDPGGDKSSWRERVFIVVRSQSTYDRRFSIESVDPQIQKWLFADAPDMFYTLPYVMDAVYQVHREFMIQQMTTFFTPELYALFNRKLGKTVKQNKEDKKQKSGTKEKEGRKLIQTVLVPNVMAYVKGKYH